MILPDRPYAFYLGIDPGFVGALALMNAAGSMLQVWDMPTTKVGRIGYNALDIPGLATVLGRIKMFPDVCVGMENPTTRPGEGAERSARFGRQLGVLECSLFYQKLEKFLISPQLWTGRLGLPGKDSQGWAAARTGLFAAFYPQWKGLLYGPRGGLLDGRLDAFLIAHFLRTQGSSGLQEVSKKFGKGSVQMQAFVLGGMSHAGKRRHRRGDLPRI